MRAELQPSAWLGEHSEHSLYSRHSEQSVFILGDPLCCVAEKAVDE